MQQLPWHTKTIPEILDALHSREHGLTKEEATERLRECGLNKLPEGKVDSLPVIFLCQFQSPLIYILLAASMIVFAMRETIDGSIILAVLFFNAIVGTAHRKPAFYPFGYLFLFDEERKICNVNLWSKKQSVFS